MSSRPHTKSEAEFERAQKVIPGGVNSPARAFGAVGGHPGATSHVTGQDRLAGEGGSQHSVLVLGPLVACGNPGLHPGASCLFSLVGDVRWLRVSCSCWCRCV